MSERKPGKRRHRTNGTRPRTGKIQTAEALILERRLKAFRLKRDGWSYREIAARLRCSLGTVAADVSNVLDELVENTQELARKERAMQLERLDIATKALMAKVRKGDFDAIHRLERLEKRRADLLGLDAPTKQQVELGGSVGLDDIDALRKAAEANGCSPPATSQDLESSASMLPSGESEPNS